MCNTLLFKRVSSDTLWSELRPDAGVGPRLNLVETLSTATDEEFRARFKGTPLTRPKRRGLLRNAAVVAANVGCEAAVPALIECIERDPEPLIRSHAIWSLSRLDSKRATPLINRLMKSDPNPDVRREIRRAANGH